MKEPKLKLVFKVDEEEFDILDSKGKVTLRGREKIVTFRGGEQTELYSGDIVVIHCDFRVYDYICEILCPLGDVKVKKMFT